MIHASKYGQADEKIDIELTEEEKAIERNIKVNASLSVLAYRSSSSFIHELL